MPALSGAPVLAAKGAAAPAPNSAALETVFTDAMEAAAVLFLVGPGFAAAAVEKELDEAEAELLGPLPMKNPDSPPLAPRFPPRPPKRPDRIASSLLLALTFAMAPPPAELEEDAAKRPPPT